MAEEHFSFVPQKQIQHCSDHLSARGLPAAEPSEGEEHKS
jgi:hypothetical protein